MKKILVPCALLLAMLVVGCGTMKNISKADRYFNFIEPLAVEMGELSPGQTMTTTVDCLNTGSCTETERMVSLLKAMGWVLESKSFEGNANHKWVLKYTKK